MHKILSKLNQSGFSAILILTIVVLVLFVAIVGNKLWSNISTSLPNQTTIVDESEYEEEDEEDLDVVDELDGVTID